MKPKINEMMTKVKNILIDNDYQTSIDLSKKTGLSRSRVFQLIRKMRMSGVGVLPSKKGYILSEFASKADDVGFLRRIYGRRASDFISLKAASVDLNKRWKTQIEKQQLQLMIQPLSVDLSSSKGMTALLSADKKINS